MPGGSTWGTNAGRVSTGVLVLGGLVLGYQCQEGHTKSCCLLLELNLITYELLFYNYICMTCEYVPCVLLSYWALAHPRCFKYFQVMMMALRIDTTASDMASM